MQYIVVPTSNSDYQSWQCRLLNWSRKKVKQQGKLIFLRCADPIGKHRPLDVYHDTDVEIIDLPDYASSWENQEPESKRGEKYWWGAIPNKFMSIKWLCDNNHFNDSDTLLFLDPDMVFVDKVLYKPNDNEIIAQRFIDYYPLQGWSVPNDKHGFGIMYPFCINFKTLKTIIEDYKFSSEEIKRQTYRWESEMWGLDYAVKKNNLKIQYIENFGFCTAWKENGSKKVSQIIHYPNPVVDINNNLLFFKQDYTFNPNMKIQTHLARNEVEKTLLSIISQERTDYRYYLKWNIGDVLKKYTGKNGYVILRPWPGGFNNIRMSLELAVCITYLTNKTLVLPPKYQMYLLKDEFGLEDFFDLTDLGINSIKFDEFCKLKNIPVSFEDISTISKVITEPEYHVLNFSKTMPNYTFTKNRRITNMIELLGHDECLFFDSKLLGNFYQTIYSEFDIELKQLIARHVHYTDHIFHMGWQAVQWLEDKSYYAIHVRRNDFQYKHLFITAEQIYENIKNVIPDGSKLYIATDHEDKLFFEVLSNHYELYFYDDVVKGIQLNVHYNFIPMIEQLICSRAISFIGNDHSTLSSYVYRLRGYMTDIEDKNFYINTSPYIEKEQCDFIDVDKFIGNWTREFKDVWNFNHKKIFVSIASYCDRQLMQTLENLYETACNPSRITVGVHLQDTDEYHNTILSRKFPNLKIIFTKPEDSRGVVWAREKIKDVLITDEDYFLQIDSHSRFKNNWDAILVNQHRSMVSPKTVISTYPNAFDLTDNTKQYLNIKTNAPLIIREFFSEIKTDNRLHTRNLDAMKDYDIVDTRWIGAGFIFAPMEWVNQVRTPTNIKSKGEEDFQTYLSYLKGWDIKLAAEAVVWHNYNVYETDGTVYRKSNLNTFTDNSINEINAILFNNQITYTRSLQELESYLGIQFKKREPSNPHVSLITPTESTISSIDFIFDWNKIPLHDSSKNVLVAIFAFFNINEKEIYRSDIYDMDVIHQIKNYTKFNIPTEVCQQIYKCCWTIKYTDDSFDVPYMNTIMKTNNTFQI